MSEYIITTEQLTDERRQAYEAGKRNREVWTAREYHGEEIVRCRDCKHYEYAEVHRFDGARRREPTCARLKGCAVETKPDGFCAWGESAWVKCKCGEDIERHDRIQICPSCGRKVMA